MCRKKGAAFQALGIARSIGNARNVVPAPKSPARKRREDGKVSFVADETPSFSLRDLFNGAAFRAFDRSTVKRLRGTNSLGNIYFSALSPPCPCPFSSLLKARESRRVQRTTRSAAVTVQIKDFKEYLLACMIC